MNGATVRERIESMVPAASAALLVMLSPGVAFAAEGGGGPPWLQLIAATINLSLLVGLIAYFGRKPILEFFEERKQSLTREIEEAKAAHQAAEERLAEYEKRLEQLDAEREQILAEFRELGEQEKERIIAEAKERAQRIERDAKRTIEQETRRAKERLEHEVAEIAVRVARAEIESQMNPMAQQRLVDRFIDQLGERTER